MHKPKPLVRCSSLNQLLGCHGSRGMQEFARERFPALAAPFLDDETSRSGSWTHFRAALRLVLEQKAIGEPEIPFSAEPMVDKFEQWVEDFYVQQVSELTPGDHALAVERRIIVESPRFILSGQIDCFSINAEGTEAVINDLKTGYTKVDAAEYNWQLYGYLVLLLSIYPNLKRVTLRIIQPRNDDEERISETTVEASDILIQTLIGDIEQALDNPDELNTGLKQCRWCAAQLICPAVKLLRQAMKLKLTKESLKTLEEVPELEVLGEWARDAKILGTPMKNAKELLKAQIIANNKAPILLDDGTEICVSEENGAREVTRIADMQERCVNHEIPFLQIVTVSLPKLEEQVAKAKTLPKSSKDPEKMTAPKYVKQNFSDLYIQKVNQELVIQ